MDAFAHAQQRATSTAPRARSQCRDEPGGRRWVKATVTTALPVATSTTATASSAVVGNTARCSCDVEWEGRHASSLPASLVLEEHAGPNWRFEIDCAEVQL